MIGVMEPGVRFLPSPGAAKEPNYDVNAKVDFWVPADPDPKYLKDPYWNVVARLRDGATRQQGQQELAVLASREARVEKKYEGFAPQLEPLTDEMNRDGRRILLPLLKTNRGKSSEPGRRRCANKRSRRRRCGVRRSKQ